MLNRMASWHASFVMGMLLLGLGLGIEATGQVPGGRINLGQQGDRDVNFSAADFTRPFKTGTTLPGTCTVGDMYFKADATAGQNLYGCTAANVWSLQAGGGSGGGAGATFQLTDFAVQRSSATTLVVGNGCAATTPCNVGFGNTVHAFMLAGNVTLTGGSGTAYVYIDGAGNLTVGHNVTLSCDVGCTATAGITSFPSDSIPLATWNSTGGSLDLSGGMDFRSFLSSKTVASGVGIVGTDVGGVATLSADTTVLGLRVAAPATVASTCATGSWASDGSFYYLCVATNSWKRTAIAAW